MVEVKKTKPKKRREQKAAADPNMQLILGGSAVVLAGLGLVAMAFMRKKN